VKSLALSLPHARCEVSIGVGLISKIPALLRKLFGSTRALVVADRNTARYARGWADPPVVLPAGERTKSSKQLLYLWNELAARRIDRYTPVVAVGGGVIGDLAGFAAATYMRGVPLVQVPTSMLAQVDASIGGKTAVNLPQGKNLAGVFYQPRAIVIDPRALLTLSEREYRTGLAEAVKYGMIKDAGLFRLLERSVERLRGRDLRLLEEIIVRCVRIKLGIVKIDEREKGPRMILNYGHTIGHAIEKATAYRINHGEAISIGMNLEGQLAVKMRLLRRSVLERQNELLLALGLPIEESLSRRELLSAMALDKKARAGKIRFVLPTGVGKVRFPVVVPPKLFDQIL
jgi:3-dehydroquinate synthase